MTTTMVRVAAIISLLAARAANAEDTASPNTAIAKPDCGTSDSVSIRYAVSSEMLYLEAADGFTRGGCRTLTDIWKFLAGSAPLYAVDPDSGKVSTTVTGTWLLTRPLFVKDGITLQVHGSANEGDADELRLESTGDHYINLRAHGGSLDFVSTKVFAWDTDKNEVDKDEDDGRSYISAISEVILDDDEDCDGKAKNTMGQARMDIEDSEMAYLGFHDSEAYGLTWKVRGYCKDESNPEVFDKVNVYGNIYDSDIHHNHFGVYTYGHEKGDWRRNKMHDNTAYGFDPHDDSDYLTIHDNEVYNNENHGIIASKRCNGVSIQGNTVYNGGDDSVGIFLHRSSNNAVVKGNHVYKNGDAGMALMETFDAEVSDNTFEDNKYGIRMSVGCGRNVFSNNVISDSDKYNIFTYEGSDKPWTVDSGRMQDNVFSDNTIDGADESIKLKQADGTKFIDNTFEKADTVRFDDCEKTYMSGNTGLGDANVKIDGACFDSDSDSEKYTPSC